MGQLEERLVSYLLDLTEDGVCSLDLPFAQLPQGHLLKVNLRRQGDFFPFESWALSGAMMGEPDQTSPQASRAPKEADTVCWVLLRRPGDLIPQALQPYRPAALPPVQWMGVCERRLLLTYGRDKPNPHPCTGFDQSHTSEENTAGLSSNSQVRPSLGSQSQGHPQPENNHKVVKIIF